MQIKQQQQIRAFLSEKFGGDSGSMLFERQEALLQGCIARTEGKSPNQMKTLTETILPRVALYKALSERFPHEDAYKTMRAYMLEIVAPRQKWRPFLAFTSCIAAFFCGWCERAICGRARSPTVKTTLRSR